MNSFSVSQEPFPRLRSHLACRETYWTGFPGNNSAMKSELSRDENRGTPWGMDYNFSGLVGEGLNENVTVELRHFKMQRPETSFSQEKKYLSLFLMGKQKMSLWLEQMH